MSDTKIVEAIRALSPNAEWTVSYSGTVNDIEWLTDGSKPSNEEIEAKRVEILNSEGLRLLRSQRNAKLTETDWVVTMHKELGTNIPAAMKTYRQALRDITDSATSLDDVTWPEKP